MVPPRLHIAVGGVTKSPHFSSACGLRSVEPIRFCILLNATKGARSFLFERGGFINASSAINAPNASWRWEEGRWGNQSTCDIPEYQSIFTAGYLQVSGVAGCGDGGLKDP